MTLGEFREKTKDLPDDYNLILSIYSEFDDGMRLIEEVDSMNARWNDNEKEIYILN